MLSIYPIIEALSPEGKARLKKGAIGTGIVAAGAETVGKVGQKINTDKVNAAKRGLKERYNDLWSGSGQYDRPGRANIDQVNKDVKNFNDDRMATMKHFKPTEEKAEAFRKIRPTQIIKSAIDKYQDNK